ncbi:hypothetical protein RB195_013735 [Necator americanus]|uniref:Reverse transcriptase domain-containing protein n=1 Tax=Necator americanus TaxID=51031 RepID=A0ABR1DY47_NECAM
MTADSHVHLPPHYLREDGHVIPKILPSEVRHAIMSDSYAASILTVSTLIEVSGEYKTLLTFIDLNKAFDSVEKEAVMEALDNQDVSTQHLNILQEL